MVGGSEVKASACNVEDLGSIPGLGRSPGEGNGNPLQYSSLENPLDGGLQSMGLKESDTAERLHFIMTRECETRISSKSNLFIFTPPHQDSYCSDITVR